MKLCPICQYSLAGLPAPHRCPECGFRYDLRTRMWSQPPSRGQIIGLVGYVIGGIGMWVGGSGGGLTGSRLLLWPYTIAGAFLVWHTLRSARRRPFVVAGPDGIAFRQIGNLHRVDWDDIRAVRPQRYDLVCRIHTRDVLVTYIIAGVFRTRDEVVDFVKLTESYMERGDQDPSPRVQDQVDSENRERDDP